jgi:hypothetical protein
MKKNLSEQEIFDQLGESVYYPNSRSLIESLEGLNEEESEFYLDYVLQLYF